MPLAADFDAIEERAALAADCVPACYLDAWARLNASGHSPFPKRNGGSRSMTAGLFLDAWGAIAAEMRWTPGELFDLPRKGSPGGLVWELNGERVNALGEDRARLTDGRTIGRQART